jgi:hypothetical protein
MEKRGQDINKYRLTEQHCLKIINFINLSFFIYIIKKSRIRYSLRSFPPLQPMIVLLEGRSPEIFPKNCQGLVLTWIKCGRQAYKVLREDSKGWNICGLEDRISIQSSLLPEISLKVNQVRKSQGFN